MQNCKTRWTERDTAYEYSYLSLPFVIEALEIINGTQENLEKFSEEVQNDKFDRESKTSATALLKSITSFQYIIGVVTLYYLLHPLR